MNRLSLPILTASLLAAVSCSRPDAGPPAGAAMPPPSVTVETVKLQPVTEYVELTGRVEAVEAVEVRPRVTGYLQEVRFQAGQLVKKDDVLFVIDPRWHQAALEQAEAAVARAEAAILTAEADARKADDLAKVRAISADEGVARKARLADARASLQASQAARDVARLDREYCEVKAPISGKISRPMLTAGNYVSGVAGFTSLLTSIVSVDPVYVYADVDEATVLRLQKSLGDKKGGETVAKVPVEMALADETGFPHKGSIESWDNRLSASTGTMVLRTVFDNPGGRLTPGLFARLRLPSAPPAPGILVDESIVSTDQNKKYIMALTPDNTVEFRFVELGGSIDRNRVVRSGLKEGDRIVVNGMSKIFMPGTPVIPEAPSTAPAPGVSQR